MSKAKFLIIALFAAASLLRLADAFRPINHASWRESDLGSISRNFAQEGMNPLYPRIDWRGDGPGYTEMELPVHPFLTAITYQAFGIHDQFGRFWAFLFSLGAMFFFFKLAREYLSLFAATVAFAFFALNPLIVVTATSIQPEGLMLFAYIASVYFFIRWLRSEENRDFWPAAAMTALALLAKAPSAHIGLFFGILLIEKYGWSVLRQGRVWVFGILAVVPSALWYFHAKNLWLTYGNSLGVSNEYHWIGWDFFTNPDFIAGILRSEVVYVWISFGLVVGLFAVWRGYAETTAKHSLVWLAAIFAFYVLAARTSSEDWAHYYHVFSIPPVALLFGFSIKKLWDYAREFADTFSTRGLPGSVFRIAVILIVIGSIFASLLIEAKQVRAGFLGNRLEDPSLIFAYQIKPKLTSDGLIIVSGGHCKDPNGYPLAYNASFMFYWLERKGWNICVEDQSIAKVRELTSRGAKYFVAQSSYLREKPGFEEELGRTYPTLAESTEFAVFDLTEGK